MDYPDDESNLRRDGLRSVKPVLPLAVLFSTVALAQSVAPSSSMQMVSYCGGRADIGPFNPANVCIFDSPRTQTCSSPIPKPSYPTQQRWGLWTTNCGVPTTSDGGVGKSDVLASVRGTVISSDASCGNARILPNGGVIFECLRAGKESVDADPGVGQAYDLYACKSIPCTTSNMALIYSQTVVQAFCTSNPASCETASHYDWTNALISGGLDPHFMPWDQNTILWNVLEATQSIPSWCTWGNDCAPLVWAVHLFKVDWTGAAPALSSVLGRWAPGNYSAYAGATYGGSSLTTQCSKYYKATSAALNADGSYTVYTQADQVTYKGSTNIQGLIDPNGTFVNVPGCVEYNCQNPCYAIGATVRQSGLFSFTAIPTLDATNNSPAGANWTQIAPLPWQKPGLINGEYQPYFEFPLILTDGVPGKYHGDRMFAISNSYSGLFGFINDYNESNHHDDYYVIDTTGNKLTGITNADVPGSPWNTALKNGGYFLGMADANYNPLTYDFITRVVNLNGQQLWVIRFPMNYVNNPLLRKAQITGKASVSGKAAF